MSGIEENATSLKEVGTSIRMASQTFLRIRDNIELIKVSGEKHKYINTLYKKVPQKMYDYTCDIQLNVGTETFRAHRDVLSDASDYFVAMFSVDMKEKDQEAIELYDISAVGFSNLLEYFYHGHITLDTKNIDDILEAARFFHVEWLLEISCDFLVRHLSIENYYNVLHLADKYCLGDLSEDIFKHIGQHFLILSSQAKFMMLSFELLHQLLSNDYFIAAAEQEILKAVLQWIDHDDRSQYLVALFKEIRFSLLDQEDLESLPEVVSQNPGLSDVIAKAKEYADNPYIQCLVEPSHASMRGSKFTIGMISFEEDIDFIQFKAPMVDGFYMQPMLTSVLYTDIEYACVTSLGNFVFVVGGYDAEYCSSNLVYRYDPRNFGWIDVAPMNEPRVGFGLCATSNALFAMCGVRHTVTDNILNDQDTYLCTVEKYDPAVNEWSYLPSVPFNCYNIAAASFDDRIYITGGITDNPEDAVPVNYHLMFVPGDEAWTPLEPMQSGRSGHSMVAHNSKMYVFGGCTSSEMSVMDCLNNEVYDIETSQWTQIRSTPRAFGRFQKTIAHLDNCLYLLGGSSQMRYLCKYDIENDSFAGENCGHSFHKLVTLRVGLPEETEVSC